MAQRKQLEPRRALLRSAQNHEEQFLFAAVL